MSESAGPGKTVPEPSLETMVSQTLGAETTRQVAVVVPQLVQDLHDIDVRLNQVLQATYPQLTEAARYACSTGGKRVRPLLMAATARAVGAPSTRRVHSLAAAFQLTFDHT